MKSCGGSRWDRRSADGGERDSDNSDGGRSTRPGSGKTGADNLVSCYGVAERRNDENVSLVEVDVDTDAYGEGHIEGAIGWNWTTQLQDQTRRDILTREAVEELLTASGIG